MAWNILTSWGAHLIFIISGFVMPRLIDHEVGQRALGIWDFGWSLVSYFELAQVGIGSSGNRFVAKYRAVHDTAGLNRAVSTVTALQAVAALIVACTTVALVHLLPVWFGDRLGSDLQSARWVVGFLGASLAIEMLFDGYRGVITGCHRWDIHNALGSGAHLTTTLGMIVALMVTGDLRSLAAVYLLGMIGSETTRAFLAHRVCPELRLSAAAVSLAEARLLLTFGGKTMIDALSRLLLFQANNLMVATYLGAATLAVFARSGALVRHGETLINKFAFVLTPAASSLKSSGQADDLRALFLDSTRFAAYIVVPMALTLALVGDLIMLVWMGPNYQSGPVLLILVAGYFLPMTQRPAMQVLMGMNLHGWVGISSLVMALAGLATSYTALAVMGWGLPGAAVALAVPMMLGKGLFTAAYACHKLRVSAAEYLRRSFLGPLACGVPFAGALLVGRAAADGAPGLTLLASLAAGALVLVPIYWRVALPAGARRRVTRAVQSRLGGKLRPAAGMEAD
jgi:O-antigen/teichoic acid export membrane protein